MNMVCFIQQCKKLNNVMLKVLKKCGKNKILTGLFHSQYDTSVVHGHVLIYNKDM